jgi:hypothetical protein
LSPPDATASPGFWTSTDLHTFERAGTRTVSLDAPTSVVLGVAIRADRTTVALSSAASPIHGIQRPSAWLWSGQPGSPWQEAATTREEFGGPNLVSLGGLTSAPDGSWYATGAWAGANGGQVAAVWRSPDGVSWQRDDTDPGLVSAAGETVSGRAIAANRCGVVVAGQALRPIPGDPAHADGALWHSADGRQWMRLPRTSNELSTPGQTDLTALVATDGGFAAAGWSGRAFRSDLVTCTSKSGTVWRHEVVASLTSIGSTTVGTVGPGPALARGPHGLVLGALAGDRWLLFSSSDGARWSALGTPPPVDIIGRPLRLSLAWDGSVLIALAEGTDGSSAWMAGLS